MGISVVHLNGKSIQHSFFFSVKKNDFSVGFTNRLRADDTHVWPRQLSRHTDDLKKVTATYKQSHPQYSTHVIPWPFPPRSTTNPAPCLCSSGKQQNSSRTSTSTSGRKMERNQTECQRGRNLIVQCLFEKTHDRQIQLSNQQQVPKETSAMK